VIRNFVGIQTLGATSMPAFGTTLVGPSSLATDRHTRNTQPSSQDSLSLIPVTSAAGFRIGDRVLVAPKANYKFGGQQDQGFIQQIDFVNNIVTVQGLLRAHANAEYLVLNEDAIQVIISTLSAANPLYVGNQSTVAAGDGSVFDVLNQPSGNKHQSGPGAKTGEYWIAGTAADQFVSYFICL